MKKALGVLVYVLMVQALAVIAMTLGAIQPALAGRDDPPQPTIGTRILGGTEFFREGIVEWEMRLDIPKEFLDEKTPSRWIYEKGMEVPQGTRIDLYILAHYGQKKIDNASHTQIHVSNPGKGEGFRLLHESRMGWVRANMVVNEWADEPMVFRIGLSPDGRHLNTYDFIWTRVGGRNTIFQRMGYTPPADIEDARIPQPYPRGSVTVQSDHGQQIASVTVVVKTAEGEEIRVKSIQDIAGSYTFRDVPVGEIRVKPSNYKGEKTWRLLGPPKLLRQALAPNGTVVFILTQDYPEEGNKQ